MVDTGLPLPNPFNYMINISQSSNATEQATELEPMRHRVKFPPSEEKALERGSPSSSFRYYHIHNVMSGTAVATLLPAR